MADEDTPEVRGRKIRKRSAAEIDREYQMSLLDDGDRVEFGFTVQEKINGREYWPKAMASTTVRPGESARDAVSRCAAVAEATVLEFIQGVKGDG